MRTGGAQAQRNVCPANCIARAAGLRQGLCYSRRPLPEVRCCIRIAAGHATKLRRYQANGRRVDQSGAGGGPAKQCAAALTIGGSYNSQML